MAELDFKIVEKKVNPCGRELWLVERPDGGRSIFMPRPGGKDKIRVELLQQLRLVLASSAGLQADGLIKLQGVKTCEEFILLDFGNLERLWANWEVGVPEQVTPSQAADLLRKMTSIIGELQDQGIAEFVVHPTDIVGLGGEGFGVVDPRIGAAFEAVDSVRPHRELCLPPEVIHGRPWSVKSMLYIAGLTVYTVFCGRFPFKMESLSESASAVLNETPLDPRSYAPEASPRLAVLIHSLLEKDPERRADLESITRTLAGMTEQEMVSTPAEQETFKTEIKAEIAKRERIRQVRRVWKIGRWAAAACIVIAAVVFFARPGYKAKITKATPPQKVVDQFYTAYRKLDVLSLDETLYKTGKEIDQMISSAFVLSSYNPEQKVRKILVMKNLQVKLVGTKPAERYYTAQYHLELYNSGGRNIQQRADRLILRPVRGRWRIVNFKTKIVTDRFVKDPHASKRLDKLIRKR